MTSYLRKVEAERLVLRTVNRRYPGDGLHGLSMAAIETWTNQETRPPGVVKELHELGELIGAMCEHSGERNSLPDRNRTERATRAAKRFAEHHA